ncbi:MAG TPA: hypothetical protein VIL86_12625, partial [Tepidisphaeraceae bacterium]
FIHLRQQRFIRAPNPFGYLCILHAQVNESKPKLSRKVEQVIFGQALSLQFVHHCFINTAQAVNCVARVSRS